MTTLSGWCTGPPGATHTAAQHQTCTQRMADGLLAGCGCVWHQGDADPGARLLLEIFATPLDDDETKEAS